MEQMQQVAEAFASKGLWYAISTITTIALGAVGFAVKNETSHRKSVSKKIAALHGKVDDANLRLSNHKQHVLQNHPDKDDLRQLMDRIDNGFKDLKDDIRDIRNKT